MQVLHTWSRCRGQNWYMQHRTSGKRDSAFVVVVESRRDSHLKKRLKPARSCVIQVVNALPHTVVLQHGGNRSWTNFEGLVLTPQFT